jgi:putative ABC transport system permease protein
MHQGGTTLRRVSALAYRLLLLRYPREQRLRYGSEMRAVFEAEVERHVRDDGLRGLAGLWWKTLRDAARPLPRPVVGTREGFTGRGSMDGWLEDLRYAWRSLTRERRFTATAIAVLGVGVALNVSAFAVLNAYLLRPLPFPAAERIVSVRGGDALSWTEVDRWFERAVSWDLDVFTIVGDGNPVMARGSWVTPDFLDMYGVVPRIGRGFLPDEAGRSGAPVALVSHRLWQDRFGGDPAIVGRTFAAYTADRPDHAESFTIVGVLPADFWYFNDFVDVLAPIRDERALYAGRLRPGVSPEQAEAALTEMARARPEGLPDEVRIGVERLQDRHTAGIRPTLLVLQVAVLLVLLIACANVAVLLVIRSSRRQQELTVRRALGASVRRLSRQLLLEGAGLSGAATFLGIGLAVWGLDLTRASARSRLGMGVPGGPETLAIDGTVLAAAAGLALVVGVVFGLVPLVSSVPEALSMRPRGSTESPVRRRFRATMVAAEVALSLALLTGAGLMMRSAVHLQRTDLGFEPDGVVQATMGLRDASHPEAADRVRTFAALRDRLARVPGVEAVGLGSMGLFTTGFNPRRVESEAGTSVDVRAVTWTVDEWYFDVLGVEVTSGRGFTPGDAAGAERVAVVSRSLAAALWGDLDPLGRRVRRAASPDDAMMGEGAGPWLRVVGVVDDVTREIGGDPAGNLYQSFALSDARYMNALVRFREGALPSVSELADAVAEVDGEVPFASPRRLDDVVAGAMAPTRYVATLLGGFSFFALVLSVLGLYGVVSYAARAHQRDVAIRVALGADRGRVTALFLREGMTVVAVGILAGVLGGLALGRALGGQLHGVSPGDPITHVSIACLLASTALIAVWIPSRRAARADPMEVLREE